jgi:hypothetical protein
MLRSFIGWIYALAALAAAGLLVVICSMEARQPIPASLIFAASLLLNGAIRLRRAPTAQRGNSNRSPAKNRARVRVTWTLMEPPIRSAQREEVHAE